MIVPHRVESVEGEDGEAENLMEIAPPSTITDRIIKLEEPDFSEDEVIKAIEIPALANIDENVEVNGIKIWPLVAEVVKLAHKPGVRELYRKCTALVLKENTNMLDSAISRRVAAEFKCHGVTASRLTNYARRVKRRLPLSSRRETVAFVDLDDKASNSKPEKLEERLIKNEDLEELKQTPHHVTLVNGPFHYVPIDRSEGSNDLILFNYLFMQFIQRTHEMYRIRVPDVDLGLLRGMVLQAFDGKRNISDIAGNHLPPVELRKVCNALASILHMQRSQTQMSQEMLICTIEFLKFYNKYCCPRPPSTAQ
ncbi:hypothetical protein V3C99_002038 [Haemonchus contortus]